MLTENLSQAVFSDFGSVISSIPEDKALQNLTVTLFSGDPPKAFIAISDCFLDYESGMTALICGDRHFYLDRAVCIKSGVRFSLVPLGAVSRFCICGEALADASGDIADTPEKDLLGDVRAITFFRQSASRNFYFRGEAHEPFELVYVNFGVLHCIISGKDCELSAHSCVIINKNDWHIQYSDRPVEFFTLSFSLSGSLPENAVNRVIPQSRFSSDIIEKAVRERERQSPDSGRIEALLKVLLFEICSEKPIPDGGAKYPATVHSENEIVALAQRLVQEKITKKLSVCALANELHISTAYLFRLFNNHLGMPPGEYIARIRMEECKLLLVSGQYGVGDVARLMGFSGIQHFSRQFHKICGITPSEYARSIR